MNYLSIEDVGKTYGEKKLFSHVSMGLDRGQKVALIARNGRGKSTLMQIILGKVLPDQGKVSLRKDIQIAYLPQSPEVPENQSLLEYLLEAEHECTRVLRQYEQLLWQISKEDTPALHKALEESMAEMDRLHAWNYEERVKEVLFRLELPDVHQTLGKLSGGQQKKAALAKVLLSEADLLLLDEPTNHLDLDMIEWLEDFLNRQNISILLITHDRSFLDSVCTEIVEIDQEQTYSYKGNYAYFLEKKAERESIALAEWEKAKNLYRRELEWMRRMPSARSTKARARIDAFEDLKNKVSLRPKEESVELNLQSERIGKKIMEVNQLGKSYGNKVLVKDFSYTFKRGERIGIVGPNGVGKSTLLQMLTGKIKPDEGHISVGATIQFGYYEQGGLWAPSDQRVIDIIKETAEVVKTEQGGDLSASQFLQYFQFDPTTQYNYFSLLSGGEKRRLYLLKTLMAHPNFLILDEPTNDLDVFTLMLLENFLARYEGCVLMVSHDRSFVDRLADHLFIFEGDGQIKDYYGTYGEYKKAKAEAKNLEKGQIKKENTPPYRRNAEQPRKNKPSYKQLKEKENLEVKISQLSLRKSEIEQIFSSPQNLSPQEINRLSTEIAEVNACLDQVEMRWLELSEEYE